MAANNTTLAFFFSNTTSCLYAYELLDDIVNNKSVQVILSILYAIVWSVGVTGNVLVLYVAACQHISFTVRTVFIVSLACSDLLICSTSLPITAVTVFTKEWIFPELLCYPMGTIQGSAICISSFTLTAIAIDRSLLILYPAKAYITYSRAIGVVLIIWTFGYVCTCPMAIFTRLHRYDGVCGKFCEEMWPGNDGYGHSSTARKVYGMSILSMQFGLPLIICSLCYWQISVKLAHQMRMRQTTQAMLPESAARLLARRRRTNRMMVAMVVCFALAYFPLNFFNLVRDYNLVKYFLSMNTFSVSFSLGHLTAMTSVVWNPIIYSWFNESFRASVKKLFPFTVSSASRADRTEFKTLNMPTTDHKQTAC